MALTERIATDMKAALLSGDRFVGNLLRDVRAAILNEEVAQGKREQGLSDSEAEAVIAREVKKRRESAALYRDNGRDDLAQNEDKERAVLEQYLPAQISDDDLQRKITDKIAELGVDSPQDMGKEIGALKSELGQSVDGAKLAQMVKTSIINT